MTTAFTEEELQAMNGAGAKKRSKRSPHVSREQREQITDVNVSSQAAITSLAQSGVNGINAQVFALDSKLTNFERDTAHVLADRLRQSPVRIQYYLAQELESEGVEPPSLSEMVDVALEVPDLTGDFLSIAPHPCAGALPM